jgi:hypothetical protein
MYPITRPLNLYQFIMTLEPISVRSEIYGSTQISQSDWIELNCGKKYRVLQEKSKDLVTENDNAIIEKHSSINNF